VLSELEKAKYVVIECDNATFCNASALYTHILRLHKKVSLYAREDIGVKLSFIPWYNKLRRKKVTGADCYVVMKTQSLYEDLINNNIQISEKMALALYADYFLKSQKMLNPSIDGTFFAQMGALASYDIDLSLVREKLLQSEPLSLFRLRAIMFQKMRLIKNGTIALFQMDLEYLKATGASREDMLSVAREALNLVHVTEVQLRDGKEKLTIKENSFGI